MNIGRTLIVAGVVLIVAGILMSFGKRLPGDIVIRGKNSVFYFPIVTCLAISIILSLIAWLVQKR